MGSPSRAGSGSNATDGSTLQLAIGRFGDFVCHNDLPWPWHEEAANVLNKYESELDRISLGVVEEEYFV